jgi:hypothetical protein
MTDFDPNPSGPTARKVPVCASGGPGGSGTVTSVGVTVPAFLSVAGSPVTTAGSFAITYSGTALPVANGGTGLTALGTGISTFLGGGALDLNGNTISDYLGVVKTDTSTSYATINSDTGKIVELNNGSAIAVTLHKAAPVGHNCVFVQMGAGQVTFAPEGGGGIMRSYLSLTKTAGLYAVVSAYVRTNSGGNAAEWVLSGTMA